MSTEAQRIEHGMWWGAVATVASGLVVLVMMALHLWPPRQPLTVMMVHTLGREYLGREGSTFATWLLAGVIQVAWGAFCGGMFALLTERMTWGNIVGFAGLRWLFTGTLVAPTLGWGDFGLLHLPVLSLATMLPHLAYSGCLGWLMHQEEEGRAAVPLHFHWPHLHLRPLHLGRTRRH